LIELVRVGTDEIPITQKRCSAMKNVIGLIAASCLLPTVSHAAETPIGTLVSYGDFSLHRLSANGSHQDYWYGDFGVRLKAPQGATALSFGAYVGYTGFGTFEGTLDYAYPTAALVIESGRHEVSVGLPKSVLSDTFDRKDRLGNSILDLEIGFFTDMVLYARLISDSIDETGNIYGVRYDTEWGDSSLSAGGFWGALDSEEFRSVQVAFEHRIRNWSLRAGAERADFFDGETIDNFAIGATGEKGRFSFGIDAYLTTYSLERINYFELFGTYRATESIKASVSHVSFDTIDSSFTTVSAEYTPNSSTFVRLSTVFGLVNDGADELFEASVGIRF